MSVGDKFAFVVCGAGVASMVWSWLAWRETFQWMALVDRCIANMERIRKEIDTLKARNMGGGERCDVMQN